MGSGSDSIMIMAGIHGNEPAGTPLVRMLTNHLLTNRTLLEGKKVIILPEANPDGIVRNTRANARGIDLNRNFSTSNRVNNSTNGETGLTEPESQALESLILQHKPNRIVSIHQPLDCIDYDGPAQNLAELMSANSGIAVKKLGARPGSLGSFVGITLNTPIVTVELPKDATYRNQKYLWERYGQMLLAAIKNSY